MCLRQFCSMTDDKIVHMNNYASYLLHCLEVHGELDDVIVVRYDLCLYRLSEVV